MQNTIAKLQEGLHVFYLYSYNVFSVPDAVLSAFQILIHWILPTAPWEVHYYYHLVSNMRKPAHSHAWRHTASKIQRRNSNLAFLLRISSNSVSQDIGKSLLGRPQSVLCKRKEAGDGKAQQKRGVGVERKWQRRKGLFLSPLPCALHTLTGIFLH